MVSESTAKIREIVKQLAYSGKSIWPNGLGFSCRGWEYRCRGADYWSAYCTKKNGEFWLGYGETPTDAKANAFPQPD